jgi:hypothetical protein
VTISKGWLLAVGTTNSIVGAVIDAPAGMAAAVANNIAASPNMP